MSKRKKVSLIQIAVTVLIITALVFIVKGIIGFFTERFGTVSAADAAAFLDKYGWEVKESSIAAEEIVIPAEFSEVYERYNAIQLSQGYDLSEYKGEKVIKYTFTVTNYKGYDNVEAHVLVKGGKIIGGDLCSTELRGFMTGFDGKN